MKQSLALSFAMFFSFFCLAQPCIKTNSILLNSGYDQSTAMNTGLGQPDPYWIILNANNIPGATNNTNAIACNQTPGSASNLLSRWIGFATSSQYVTNNATIGHYLITFRFPFTTCLSDSLWLDMNVANDNYISQIRVDGVPIGFSQAVSQITSNWQNFSPVIHGGVYPAGNHTIEIDVQNFNVANAMNPHMLNVHGTLNSLNSSIVSKTSPNPCNCNNDSIVANYVYSFPNNCDSLFVQFTDLSQAFNSSTSSWLWTFGDGAQSNLQNPSHTYLNAGTYVVQLIASNNLGTKDTFFQTVTAVSNKPVVTGIATPNVICLGESTILSGNGAVSYSWSNNVINGIPVFPLNSTTYTVIGTNSNGCSDTNSVLVTVIQNIPISISPANPILCLGDTLSLTAIGAQNYVWSPAGTILNSTTSNPIIIQPTNRIVYNVIGTDANGCIGTASTEVNVVSEPTLILSKSNDIDCSDNTVQLNAEGATTYSWSPPNGLSDINSASPTVTIKKTTTYFVTGTIGSCTSVDSITVFYYNNDRDGVFVPNAFTPNGDGLNDCFRIRTQGNYAKYELYIYNRWGMPVFESENSDDCWNGTYGGKDVPVGVYYYYLNANSTCGPFTIKGDISVVK